jgi:hypothetical protein
VHGSRRSTADTFRIVISRAEGVTGSPKSLMDSCRDVPQVRRSAPAARFNTMAGAARNCGPSIGCALEQLRCKSAELVVIHLVEATDRIAARIRASTDLTERQMYYGISRETVYQYLRQVAMA